MQFSENWKTFSQYFFLHFLNLDSIFNIFKKKMTLKAYVFLNIQTPKNVVKEMSKKSPCGGPFNK